MRELRSLVRKNILNTKPYSSARDEYSGKEGVFLDANENPYGSAGGFHYNRYPDPFQHKLKEQVSRIKGMPAEHIFLGNGSDEPIDLLFRIFCEPGVDNAVIMPPTYGMYAVCGAINGNEIRTATLTSDFNIDLEAVFNQVDENTKLLFICSPNNPSGNKMSRDKIDSILERFDGITVLDEAYIDFTQDEGYRQKVLENPKLVVLHTFSKAWGMAGIRLGMAFASNEVMKLLNAIKYPYNINEATQEIALKALQDEDWKNNKVKQVVEQREKMAVALEGIDSVEKIYPSDANFLLIKIKNAHKKYYQLIEKKVIVRDRSNVTLCDDCLRITIGIPEENEKLLEALKIL